MKTLTPHAACAKAIRTELKAAFPDVKFSVKSRGFSMGNSVTVRYPATGLHPHEIQRVKAIAERYQVGHFDGMTDSYDYSNRRDDLPQVKYVHVERGQ